MAGKRIRRVVVTVNVEEEIWMMLHERKHRGDTLSDVIRRLMLEADEKMKYQDLLDQVTIEKEKMERFADEEISRWRDRVLCPYAPTPEDIEKYGSDLSKHPKVIGMALKKYEEGDIVEIDLSNKEVVK